MPGRLAAWRKLGGDEQLRLLGLACALPVVELSLRCVGAQRTSSWLSRAFRTGPAHPANASDMQHANRLAELAAIAGRRGVIDARCLSQALLVRALLRQHGLDAALRVGVLKDDDRFDAHAWLELEGRALGQQSVQHVPFPPDERITRAMR